MLEVLCECADLYTLYKRILFVDLIIVDKATASVGLQGHVYVLYL